MTAGEGATARRGPRDGRARGVRRAGVLAVLLASVACNCREPIASCDDDLRGVYAAGDERWMVLDRGGTLEAYPLFSDGMPPDPAGALAAASAPGGGPPTNAGGGPADLVVAPRMIELRRALPAQGATLAGTLRRRYMRGSARCEARVPVHLTRCAGDTLELVLADPAPPLAFSPCTWSRPGPSRVARWRRE